MKVKWTLCAPVAAALVVALCLSPMAEAAKKRLAYGGGPVGGTFQYFANATAIMLSKGKDHGRGHGHAQRPFHSHDGLLWNEG